MTDTTTAAQAWAGELGPGGLEVRSLPKSVRPVLARAADTADTADGAEAPVIEGFGSVYEQVTTVGSYYPIDEVVAAGAWGETIKAGDIRSMLNHSTDRLLGRTKSGSLRLEDRPEGLWYAVDVNVDDPHAMSAHAQVSRGDIDGSSVWFRVVREEWTEPTEANGLERPLRRILEAQLFEVGPVVFPAFEQTTSSARTLAPLDAALRAAGVAADRRARLASDLVAADAEVEQELRRLFTTSPELRDRVCSCTTDDLGRAANAAPPRGAATSAPDPRRSIEIARARLDLLGRR